VPPARGVCLREEVAGSHRQLPKAKSATRMVLCVAEEMSRCMFKGCPDTRWR